ncbi:hypothetical protein RJ639_024790 [Escallonia herrerae]|uniref:G domain-containing protein n=1 Tax=Escallonia herrerae TaxID=1293975 RepID=A0AA88UXA9_9ASTE|nr:hypothetical protein RJ639_024790 [Escallonia herrerae]
MSSDTTHKGLPVLCSRADGLPEFALVGLSNVGKSSLLDSLVRRKKRALTSKKPVLNTED